MARTKERLGHGSLPPSPPAQLRPSGMPPGGPRRSARIRGEDATIAPNHHYRVSKPQHQPKPNSQPVRFECTTCDRKLVASSFPKYATTDKCKHLINTCRACLKEWISMSLNLNMFDQLACPECPEKMESSDVKIHGIKQDHARFIALERKKIAEAIPGWRWCMAPKCKGGQVHPPAPTDEAEAHPEVRLAILPNGRKTRSTKKEKASPDGISDPNLFTCNTCRAQACVGCDRPYHNSETCEQYKARLAKEDEMSERFIAEATKKCPSCSTNIQRDMGCDYLLCTQCNEAFCWRCLVGYKVINVSGHAKGCVYAVPGNIDPHAQHLNHVLARLQDAAANADQVQANLQDNPWGAALAGALLGGNAANALEVEAGE